MPYGLRRFHHSGQSHFVTFSCYHHFALLDTAGPRDVVVAALERARRKYQFRVYGFVVMPDHAHLLISEPERATLANAMQSLKISSSKRTAGVHPTSPLWQPRGYDRNIRDAREFAEKLEYIHANPVKRNLCVRPEDSHTSKPRAGLLGTPHLEMEQLPALRDGRGLRSRNRIGMDGKEA